MAISLRRVVSVAGGRVTDNSPPTRKGACRLESSRSRGDDVSIPMTLGGQGEARLLRIILVPLVRAGCALADAVAVPLGSDFSVVAGLARSLWALAGPFLLALF